MKKSAIVLIMVLSVIMITACAQNVAGGIDNAATDNGTISDNVVTNTETESAPEVVSEPESEEPEATAENIDIEPQAVFADFLENVVKESASPDEVAFATVDVDIDGTMELLYTESNVNASGVYICFLDNGEVVPVGPFGCNGGIKYISGERTVVSVVDNMDYMNYEISGIDSNYQIHTYNSYAIEPDLEEENAYIYYANGNESSHDVLAHAFEVLNGEDIRSVEYSDMYQYAWTVDSTQTLADTIKEMFTYDIPGRACHMIIPPDEKAKLVGTWNIYSSEVEGAIYYADVDGLEGKVIIHDDYTVDIYRSEEEGVWYEDMQMYFVNGCINDSAENTDWYVYLLGDDMGADQLYMNVNSDDQLRFIYMNEEDFEYPIASWGLYSRE